MKNPRKAALKKRLQALLITIQTEGPLPHLLQDYERTHRLLA